jgi:hypothetical protein
MSTVKEVSVRLTEADEKALVPRRKRTRKNGGMLEGAPVPPMETKPTEAPALPTQVLIPPEPAGIVSPIVEKAMNFETALPPPPPVLISHAPTPVQAPAPQGGAIKIQTKKRHSVGTVGTRKGPIILPFKRHKQPAKDKPKLVIPISVPVAPTVPTSPTAPTAPTVSTTKAKGKRRFTERRLSISVKTLQHTRKAGKSIRKQVAAMTTDEIRKVLLEKKILKPSSNPPETMLRSMMKDYLALAK